MNLRLTVVCLGVLAMLTGCQTAGARTLSGPSVPRATESGAPAPSSATPANLSLTADQMWKLFPLGAEWGDGNIYDAATGQVTGINRLIGICPNINILPPDAITGMVLTTVELSSMVPTGANVLPVPNGFEQISAVTLPDVTSARSFASAAMKRAASCGSPPKTAVTSPDATADEQAWIGSDVYYDGSDEKDLTSIRSNGNVVVVSHVNTRLTTAKAVEQLNRNAGAALYDVIGALMGHEHTRWALKAGEINPDDVCTSLPYEAIASLLGFEPTGREVTADGTKVTCLWAASEEPGASVTLTGYEQPASGLSDLQQLFPQARILQRSPAPVLLTASGAVTLAGGHILALAVDPASSRTDGQWIQLATQMVASS